MRDRCIIALSPSTKLMLNAYRERKEAEALLLDKPVQDNDLLFGSLDGKPILPDTLSHSWLKLVKRTAVKRIRLHDARHTHASLLLKQGIHPKIVQERLGHASIQITLDTYSHVAPGLQAAAANSFDKVLTKKYNEQGIEAVEKH